MDLALFLTYYFPPLGGGGVQRSAKFAKYLPDFGWMPVVVTVKPNLRNAIEQSLDPTGLDDLPPGLEVSRGRPIELSVLYYLLYKAGLRKLLYEIEAKVPFLHMDYKIGWHLSALRRGARAIRRRPVKVIYSSSTPFSAHFAAARLHRRYGIPWIADFRDPWTLAATYRPFTGLHRRLERRLELDILRRADVVIANTETNRRDLLDKAGLDGGKVRVIPNGFDPADFPAAGNNGMGPHFEIACLGKYYQTTGPEEFFHGFRMFHARHEASHLALIGWQPRAVKNCVRSILAPGSYEIFERVDHRTAVDRMRRTSVLLVNLPCDSDCAHWVPGKLYEYLRAGRPILFMGPRAGEAAEIIRRTRSGIVVTRERREILEALESLHADRERGSPDWNPDAESIAQFDRRRQAGELVGIMRELTARGGPP